MIVWSGQGYLVAVIIFGASLIMNFVVDGMYGRGAYGARHWGFAVALLVAAPCLWLLGTALQKNSDRIVIDKETGKEIAINKTSHTFFFVPMKYWAIIALGWAMIELFKQLPGL